MWNPDQYLKFNDERTRPAHDLAAAAALTLGADPSFAADLGCGPGNSTAVLKARWPAARVLGVDNSADMIDRARKDFPGGEWIVDDAATWEPEGKLDLLFSNACIQWIHDHEALLPRLFSLLAPGGVLAVQVPANGDSALHLAVREVASRPRWKGRMSGTEGSLNYRKVPYYVDILAGLGAPRFEAWETTYYHRLDGGQALIEWYRGTGMRPYLAKLEGADKKDFEDEVLELALPSHAWSVDGKLLFPFKRIFFTARKK